MLNPSAVVIETERVVVVGGVRTRPREERGSLVEQMLEDHGMLDRETRIVTGFQALLEVWFRERDTVAVLMLLGDAPAPELLRRWCMKNSCQGAMLSAKAGSL
jgi:hypothetical protein